MDSKQQSRIRRPSLWSNSDFLLLWIGNFISNFGLQIYMIALPLLIYELTQSAIAMSTMRTIDVVPNIFIGLIAGVLIDRFSRKLILSLSAIIQIIALAIIIYLLLVKNIHIWHLYLLGFVLSAAGNTFWNCQNAMIPQIVCKDHLTEANAKFTFMNTLINTIGPGIAGFIIAAYSYEISFSIFLICLLALLLFSLFIQLPSNTLENISKNFSFWNDTKEGLITLFQNKALLVPTIVVLVKNLSNSLIIGILVFYLVNDLNTTEQQIGYIYSIGGIGGLIGSLVITRGKKVFGHDKIFVWAILIDIIGIIGLLYSNSWWLVGISFSIRLFGGTMSNIVYATFRQETTPSHLLGRVIGTTSMIMRLTFPLGLLLSGLWAEFFSVKSLFLCSILILTLLYFLIRKYPF
jgi:MFS family permease